MNLGRIVGAGSVEPDPRRHNSGLLLVAAGRPFLFDVTPANWSEYGDWLHHEDATFLVTHGHSDHFHPEHPWKGIFHPHYANFGRNPEDVHLYGPGGVVELLLVYNGFRPSRSRESVDGTTHARMEHDHHVLVREADGKKLHLHAMRSGGRAGVGPVTIAAVSAFHQWSYPPHAPHHVRDRAALGYVFLAPEVHALYLPDFTVDREGRLERGIAEAAREGGALRHFIVGCPNPVERVTETGHATPRETLRLFQRLGERGVVDGDTVVVLTHRNPNWERFPFENPGFDGDRLVIAERGTTLFDTSLV